jgi:hypothetical protein
VTFAGPAPEAASAAPDERAASNEMHRPAARFRIRLKVGPPKAIGTFQAF